MNRYWKKDDLALLRRLRERFIARTAGERDYWQSDEELELYDTTFGERIGWKWDAVLTGLEALGWKPRVPLLDGVRSTYEWFVANQDRALRRP